MDFRLFPGTYLGALALYALFDPVGEYLDGSKRRDRESHGEQQVAHLGRAPVASQESQGQPPTAHEHGSRRPEARR